MTIVNENERVLQINIETTEPGEDREAILKALNAAVRWYGSADPVNLHTVNNVDGQNLRVLSNLIDNILTT